MKSSSIDRVVKDIYGREAGRLVGVVLDLDGSIKSIGVAENGGKFAQYSGERLVRDEGGYIVIPDWKVEASRFNLQKQVIRKREHALEEFATDDDVSTRKLEEVRQQSAELRALHDKVKTKIESRLNELDREVATLEEFVVMAKLQRATAEIDESAYQTMTEYGRVALLTDEKEREELRRAIGFIENVEEAAPTKVSQPQKVAQPQKVTPRKVAERKAEEPPRFIDQPFPVIRMSAAAFKMPDPIQN